MPPLASGLSGGIGFGIIDPPHILRQVEHRTKYVVAKLQCRFEHHQFFPNRVIFGYGIAHIYVPRLRGIGEVGFVIAHSVYIGIDIVDYSLEKIAGESHRKNGKPVFIDPFETFISLCVTQ